MMAAFSCLIIGTGIRFLRLLQSRVDDITESIVDEVPATPSGINIRIDRGPGGSASFQSSTTPPTLALVVAHQTNKAKGVFNVTAVAIHIIT